MAAEQLSQVHRSRLRADVMALDSNEKPVLLVEIMSVLGYKETGEERLIRYLQTADVLIPYAMLVTASKIQIFKWNGRQLSEPVFESDTASMLSRYDPDFSRREPFGYYMAALIEAWLSDIAYRWKSEVPPGYPLLERAGIARLLEGNTTRTEYPL